MKYENMIRGKFKERPNRFVAVAETEGRNVRAHVKNTGRCAELLIPGADIYLQDHSRDPGKRKLLYSLISVEKVMEDGSSLMVNMDSQAPNKVVKEALENGRLVLPGMEELSIIKPETVSGASRLDFYVRDKNGTEGYIEVKGVTLEENKTALFPDAPTRRGIKHLFELKRAKEEGQRAYAVFVIQMPQIRRFAPNDKRHRAFGDALREAAAAGVCIMAFNCDVTADSISLADPAEICGLKKPDDIV